MWHPGLEKIQLKKNLGCLELSICVSDLLNLNHCAYGTVVILALFFGITTESPMSSYLQGSKLDREWLNLHTLIYLNIWVLLLLFAEGFEFVACPQPTYDEPKFRGLYLLGIMNGCSILSPRFTTFT